MLEIVFVWEVISFPTYDVKGRELGWCLIDLSNIFIEESPLLFSIFKPCFGVLEITRIGHSIRTDRAKLRESEVMAINLSYPSLNFSFYLNAVSNSSWDDAYLFGPYN